MEFSFNLIIFSFYLILGVIFAIRYFRSKIKLNLTKSKLATPKKYIDQSKSDSFSSIRNQQFPSELQYKNFFISEYMDETFNIFLKLSPAMIFTITKAEKRILSIKSLIDNPTMNEEYIKMEIEKIDALLNELIKASHQMIEKLEETISIPNPSIKPIKLDPEVVETYMGTVNIMVELSNDHSTINYEIHYKLDKSYPTLVEPFRIIISKVTYLLFINLITYSTKIDENLFIHN